MVEGFKTGSFNIHGVTRLTWQVFADHLEEKLREALRGWAEVDYKRMREDLSAIGTNPSCRAPQHRHWDWDYRSCQVCPSRSRPLSVIVSLKGGYVWVWPRDQYDDRQARHCKCTADGTETCEHPEGGSRIELKPGDALVMTGDTMHAGDEAMDGQAEGGLFWRVHTHLYPTKGYTLHRSVKNSYLC